MCTCQRVCEWSVVMCFDLFIQVARLLEEAHMKRSAEQAARGDDGLGE
jgi:hypothetical protein